MSVKRALKLDTVRNDNPPDATPLKTKKKNLKSYSPTTGTCQMSPFSSPTSHNAQNLTNHPSNGGKTEENDSESGLPRRGQPQTEQDTESSRRTAAVEKKPWKTSCQRVRSDRQQLRVPEVAPWLR